jgi:hypothetical protein
MASSSSDSSGVLAGLQAAGYVVSAYAQTQALKAQGDYQKNQSEINARFRRLLAKDALKRGDEAAEEVRKKGEQVVGSQRAAAAAQGIDVNSDTALDLQVETDEAVASDMRKIRNNAWRESWGFETEANNLISQGNMAVLSSRNMASATLLTGGLQAIGATAQSYKAYEEYKAPKTPKV